MRGRKKVKGYPGLLLRADLGLHRMPTNPLGKASPSYVDSQSTGTSGIPSLHEWSFSPEVGWEEACAPVSSAPKIG